MRALSTFRLVPRPDPAGLIPAIALLTVWSLGQNHVASLWGRVLEPLALAMAVRIILQLVYNLGVKRKVLLGSAESRRMTFFFVTLSFVACGAFVWNGPVELIQLGWSLYLFCMGGAILAFALMSPDDLHAMPTAFACAGLPKNAAIGAHAIIGVSYIAQAFTAAALARYAPEAHWVVFISAGHVLLHVATNWVVVVWLLGHEDI